MKDKRIRQMYMAALLLCCLLILAACGKEKVDLPDFPETQERPSEVVTNTEPETESHAGDVRSRYTGEWIDKSLNSVRPVAVMTENTRVTLPQYGLEKADVIYECPVEGGITRLMAIYQDYTGMDKIGNVRSCRLYYVYFAKEFNAVYFHAGESKYATDILNSSFIDNVDGITGKGGESYYRDNSRKAPHNLYTSSDKLLKGIQNYGYADRLDESEEPHYQFTTEDKPNLLENGVDANEVRLYFVDPKPYFTYNSEEGLYYRYEFGNPQIDALTGNQLTAANIILQNCQSYLKNPDNGTLDINVESGGTGKFITRGKAIDITWTRESSSAKTRYFDAEGREIVLNPGTTWVEIIESSKAEKNEIH